MGLHKGVLSSTGVRGWDEHILKHMKNGFVVLMASCFLGLIAPLAISLPFTPVPIVLQAQTILCMGALLGPQRGALAVLGFLVQGALGLPVFAGGSSGIVHLFGPTGGYLMGYLFGALVSGYLFARARKKKATSKALFLSMAAGNGVIYLLGWLQLSYFLGMKQAFLLGILPFIAADLLKLCVFSKLSSSCSS